MAAIIMPYKDQFVKMLYQKNKFNDYLALAESKTQVKREYIASGLLGVLSLYLIFGYGASLLCNLIGFLYPAWCSLKALESRSKEDDTRWLIYWVVFAVFSVLEFFSDILLSWLPFYFLAKCVFLAWCWAPIGANGSDQIYNRIIRPFFLKHVSQIDSTMGKVTDKISQIATDAATKLE